MSLKNERVSVRMLYLAGNQDLIRTCLHLMTSVGSNEEPSAGCGLSTTTLRIAQRMRLENSQLEAVQWKLREPANYCMCLALAASSESPSSSPNTNAAPTTPALPRRGYLDDSYYAQQNLVLQNIITYLQDKMAAGIISCPSTQEVSFLSQLELFIDLLLTHTDL